MKIQGFKDIVAWQKAHQFVLEVYKLSDNFPRKEDFILTNQIRRCVISVASNIAEGFKRKSKNDALHFYNIAQGSLEESRYQLLLAKDLEYITKDAYENVDSMADETGRVLYGWMRSQK